MKNKITVAVSAALMSVATLQAAVAMEPTEFTVDSFKAVEATSVNKNKSYSSKRSDKIRFEKGLANEQYTYIVRLKDLPVATYNGNVEGFAATNPQVAKKALFKQLANSKKSSQQIRKELRLDLDSPEVKAYSNYLENKQQVFLSKANSKLGSNLNVIYTYKNAFNGMAVSLTQAEAVQLADLSGVAYVERERTEQMDTDTGPILIGAPEVWSGEGQSAINMGEGVIIGIVDSGVNTDHMSFADVGGDGYDHTNPWGEGVYVGDCATDFVELCNDKLIGVRSYASVTDNYQDATVFGDTPPVANGEDYNGHGSHTASTSGGNILRNVPLLDGETGELEGDGINTTGFEFGQISGVAPHANIISYQICNPGNSGDTYSGCPGAAIIAALEDAVSDGVDVINYSISGGGDPWSSSTELAFLAAQEAGIFAAVSAGNSGPDANTTPKNAPWYTSVGASTHGREIAFEKEIGTFTGGDTELAAITGNSASGAITASIVWAGDYTNPNDTDGAPEQCLEPFPEGTFDGEIVVCDRGAIARVQKAINVADGGAGGFVLGNITDGSNTIANDVYVVPGIHINIDNGNALRTWLANGAEHSATITASTGELVIGQADDMASFSSRGSNNTVPDVMTPSVTAPGVSIYAAYSDQQFGHDVTGPSPTDFTFLQGTSMSAPHVAGAGAVLRSSHPTWTADNIRSALMLTATQDVRKEDGTTPADAFDMGTGRIQVNLADKTGLVMNETAANYMAANPANDGVPKTLNIPSVTDANCVGLCSWTRTVTATMDGSWTTEGINISDGLEITVTPASFDLAAGESQEISISVDAIQAESDVWSFGHVVMTSDAHPTARLPVNVMASNGNIPKSMRFDAHRGVDSFLLKDVMAIEISEFTSRSYGLVKANKADGMLAADSDRTSVYDDLEDGLNISMVTVPENAKRFVAEVLMSASPDLDMFVGIDTNGDGIPQKDEEIATSATGTALEKVDLMSPDAGEYWIIIQNWVASEEGAVDAYTLATAVIDGEMDENLSVEADSAIPALTDFDLRFSWSLEGTMAGDLYYGAVDLGTSAENAGNLGLVSVDLVRGVDDVSLSSDASAYMQRTDMVNYEVAVLANLTTEERTYTVQAKVPMGMELVTDSVTGDGIIDGDTITWMLTQESLFGATPSYSMTTNNEDAMCALPDFGQGGGYIDLAAFGLFPSDSVNGNDVSASFNIPANFLGKLYTSINVTEDGFVYFTGAHGSAPWVNQLLPDSNEANNVVAPFWRDNQIAQTETSGVTVATAGSAWTIIEWDDVKHWVGFEDNAALVGIPATADIADFQIVFSNATGNFMFAYDNVTHDWGGSLGATVGYEDATGTTGRADIYASSIWGGAAGAAGSVESIESGLIMCYTLEAVDSSATIFNFSTTIVDDYAGGPVNVELTHSVDAINTVEVVNSTGAAIQVEGAPTAMISAPSTVKEKSPATVDASGSTDPNGDDLTYTWTQVGGPPIDFDAKASSFTFIGPLVSQNVMISFHLTVDDGKGNSDTAIVAVEVEKRQKSGGGSFGWLLLAAPLLLLRRKK
ncbi:MAG: S8 family serine peptidase [Colwellia sp.]|nr:S8 family serine peptidase [Colwellia sp.]